MINIIFGPNIFLAGLIAIGSLILYHLKNVKPELSRDEDIFFVSLGGLYSTILTIHGWRLDPILIFSQALIIVSVLIVGWENIRLRAIILKILTKKNDDDWEN